MRNKENSIYPHVKPNCRLGQTRWWMDGQTDKPTGERTDGRMDKLTAWMHGQLERGCLRGGGETQQYSGNITAPPPATWTSLNCKTVHACLFWGGPIAPPKSVGLQTMDPNPSSKRAQVQPSFVYLYRRTPEWHRSRVKKEYTYIYNLVKVHTRAKVFN